MISKITSILRGKVQERQANLGKSQAYRATNFNFHSNSLTIIDLL